MRKGGRERAPPPRCFELVEWGAGGQQRLGTVSVSMNAAHTSLAGEIRIGSSRVITGTIELLSDTAGVLNHGPKAEG